MRVVRARCCARNLRSRNDSRRPQQLYQVNQRANINMGCSVEARPGANPAIEHPCRNLKIALRHRTADTAAVNVQAHPLDGLMNVHPPPRPGVPPIKNLAKIGHVGVPLPRCTTPSARTAALATDHRPRKWRRRLQCTNNKTGPLGGGRSAHRASHPVDGHKSLKLLACILASPDPSDASRSRAAGATVTHRSPISFTASTLNSRLNFRRCIHTLRFQKYLISVSTERAASQTACVVFTAGVHLGAAPACVKAPVVRASLRVSPITSHRYIDRTR